VSADFLSQFQVVLITSVDSTTNLVESVIGKRILASDAACTFFGSGIIVPGKIISRIAEALDLLNGFDELWCFDRLPQTPIPGDMSLVSPLNIETETVPPDLQSWMAATDCHLGLGDGMGMNFATPQPETARQIEHFAEQFGHDSAK
jgi:hypothetical protein